MNKFIFVKSGAVYEDGRTETESNRGNQNKRVSTSKNSVWSIKIGKFHNELAQFSSNRSSFNYLVGAQFSHFLTNSDSF
jgi:hypothetical protein